MPAEAPLSGWLVIDKPAGITSSRVVEKLRRQLATKTGHAGTLDPLATGVLPIALGEATKTVRWAMGAHKSYRFRIRWGIARATGDGEGAIVAESPVRPSAAAVEAILPRFTGSIRQSPPAHSAVRARRRTHLANASLAAG